MAAGPATRLIETTATSIGAGMMIGGFFGGLIALLLRRSAAERDQLVFVASSAVGWLAVVLVVAETIVG